MIRIGLVDDDQEHLRLMRNYLAQYEREEGVAFQITEFRDGLNFVEDYDGQLDIVFLDIEMPHMDGMTAARKIREKDDALSIIFLTNMAQYAIHGYEVNAVDFMVKPVAYFLFADKLRKALRSVQRNAQKTLVLQTDETIVRVTIPQILYVEKMKNYLLYHTRNGDYKVRGTISSLESSLQGEGFSQCLSGYMVNLRYVTEIGKDEIWLDDISLPISRHRKKDFKEDFLKYLGGDL